MYKKLNSKKEIKPRTYQLSSGQSLVLGDLVRIDYVEGDRNSLTFYIPNEIKIRIKNIYGVYKRKILNSRDSHDLLALKVNSSFK